MSIMRAQLPRELQAKGGISGLRHPAAYGGIMGGDGRTAYGLGSKFKRAFKKVTKPIKKIAKSPIGKAALLYGATAGLGALGAGAAGRAAIPGKSWMRHLIPSNVMSNLGATFGTQSWSPFKTFIEAEGDTGGAFGPSRLGRFLGKRFVDQSTGALTGAGKWGLGTIAASSLPFMMGQEEDEIDEISMRIADKTGMDIESIRAEVINAYKSGEDAVNALRVKYPFLADYESVNITDLAKDGGRIGMQEGGIMNLGGMEKDYRNTGGFVEIGGKERADDVPARLSRNEFVFTADAVRNAGGGDIDKGAEIMEKVMDNLEAGGKISEESQGMRGAQEMFEVSERLSEVV